MCSDVGTAVHQSRFIACIMYGRSANTGFMMAAVPTPSALN